MVKAPARRRTAPDPALPPGLAHARDGFVAYMRIERGFSRHTIEAYARDLRDLLLDLAGEGITDLVGVRPAHLVAHAAGLKAKRGMEPSSVTRHLATIRVFFRWALSTGRVTADPTDLLERPAKWRHLPGVLAPAQVERLLRAADEPYPARRIGRRAGDEAPPLPLHLRDRALLELLYASGLRATEAATLTLSDVLRDIGCVRVIGKGNKQRLVPMHREARRALEAYLADCRPMLQQVNPSARAKDLGRVFLSRTGRPLERVAIWGIVKRCARLAGLADVHPHTFRHTFATHLLSGGADLRVVQELLGHADIATTQIYTHVDCKRLKGIHRAYHPRG